MDIKIAFSDIDGTLLNKERETSTLLREEVRRLTLLGTPFILISSRMPAAMRHIQDDLGISGLPLICFNGGLVLVDEKIIHSTSISVPIIENIADLNKKKTFHISLYNNDDWFVEEMDYWAKREENNTKVSPQIRPIEEVIKDWKQNKKGAHKIMCMGEKEALDKVMEALTRQYSDELHLYRSKDTYLEIANKQISKLTGINLLLKNSYPHFTLKNAVAFGDNYNDIEMLEAVKYGVAVKNAKAEVLAISDFVTNSNKEDGVAKWLKVNIF